MHANTAYKAARAWLLASAWLLVCLGLALASGALASLVRSPQSHDAVWIVSTAAVTTYTLFAYLYYWPLGTESHGRKLEPSWIALFGAVWGLAQGLLLLSVFEWTGKLGLHRAATAAVTFVLYSTFAGVWQNRFWDNYVTPAHKVAGWDARKMLVADLPFLALLLAHLAVFDDPVLVVALFMLALTACAWSMRMPSPRSS